MTEIEVYNGAQLLGTLDINDVTNFPLAFTKSIVDYRNITQRGSTFSKQFRVTASNNNNRVLGFIYNANINGEFARDCKVKVNGIELLVGKIKVLEVHNDSDPAEYELAIFSEASDWFIDLQSKTVRDYDYGHPLIAARNNAGDGSNTASIPANTTHCEFTYPVVESSWSGTYSDGWDYVFDLKSYGQPKNGRYMDLDDMRPSLYIQGILRKAFSDIGYTFNSQFFTTGIGSKLILPFIGDNWNISDDNTRTLNTFVVGSNNQKFVTIGGLQQVNEQVIQTDTDSGLPYLDPNNIWNTNTFKGTIKYAGIYSFKYDYQILIGAPFTVTAGDFYNLDVVTANMRLYKNGVLIEEFLGRTGSQKLTVLQPWFEIDFLGTSQEHEFEVGDEIELRFFSDSICSNNLGQEFNRRVQYPPNSTFTNIINPAIIAGQTFEMSQVFEDVKVMDLIKGLANMFNLYFQTDIAGKNVLIEPRQAFYDFTSNVDWSEKLDVNNQIQIINNDNYNRIVTFSFDNDTKDEFVQIRNNQNNGQLGSFQLDLGNQFDKGTDKLGTSFFAPTINNDVHPFGQTSIIVPCMWGEPFNNPPKEYGFKQRVLYYEGFVPQFIDAGGSSAIWNWGISAQFLVPYSYQIDNSFNPIINATDRINLYYNGEGGLVDTYYRPDIAIIRDRKIVACYIYLKSIDLLTLDFGKPVYFDHELIQGEWIINQMVDYQPNNDATTLVELVKNLQYPQISFDLDIEVPQVTSSKMGLGNGTIYSGEASNSGAVLHNGSGNVGIYNGGGVVMGNGLIQSATNQHIFGNRNFQTDSLFVVGAGDLIERYNALQFTADGEFLTQGGEVYVETETGVVPVMYEKVTNGSTVTRYDIVVLASNIG